jgi:hypothetical protein
MSDAETLIFSRRLLRAILRRCCRIRRASAAAVLEPTRHRGLLDCGLRAVSARRAGVQGARRLQPGAGRRLSRHQALKQWRGRRVVDEFRERGIIIKSPSMRGVAEEAPGAYKDSTAVVEAAHLAGLSRKVDTLEPLICIKG